jgi:cation transport ATPase
MHVIRDRRNRQILRFVETSAYAYFWLGASLLSAVAFVGGVATWDESGTAREQADSIVTIATSMAVFFGFFSLGMTFFIGHALLMELRKGEQDAKSDTSEPNGPPAGGRAGADAP